MPGEPARLRAFVALEIDAGAKARLLALAESLRPSLPGVRFVRPEGVHLTLRFLGPVGPASIEALAAPLAAAAARCPASARPLGPLGMFPERGAPSVLWAGLEANPALVALQAACEDAAVAAGLLPEPRAWRPHLTLGRWGERAPRPRLPEVVLGDARLEQVVLFRSALGRGGAVYTPLAAYPLAR